MSTWLAGDANFRSTIKSGKGGAYSSVIVIEVRKYIRQPEALHMHTRGESALNLDVLGDSDFPTSSCDMVESGVRIWKLKGFQIT